MTTWAVGRITAGLAISGAVLALVGNAIAPRFNGDDVVVYHKIATSDRFAAADVIILVALVVVTAAFVGISRRLRSDDRAELLEYARVAAVVGGAIGLIQIAVELYGYRQQARAFDGANAHNVVSAFWATNALDHATSAMFASWTIVLLGIAPVLLGAAQLRSRNMSRLGWAAVVGGAVCVVVGIGELLKADQSSFDVPFAIGSVIVTLWLLATGIVMWRDPHAGAIDLADSSTRTTPSAQSVPS
jgi:hypothetical protein